LGKRKINILLQKYINVYRQQKLADNVHDTILSFQYFTVVHLIGMEASAFTSYQLCFALLGCQSTRTQYQLVPKLTRTHYQLVPIQLVPKSTCTQRHSKEK